jgi:3-hydroxybutyryl-CoA dehydrogenase
MAGRKKARSRAGPRARQRILDRILAMLINEAADAVFFRIASAADVDTAMTKGVNYPKGLLAWADELGIATVLARLEWLHAEYRRGPLSAESAATPDGGQRHDLFRRMTPSSFQQR